MNSEEEEEKLQFRITGVEPTMFQEMTHHPSSTPMSNINE